MAVTTVRAFVDNLEALSITGVVRPWTQGPPTKLETADLPASWVEFPALDEARLVFGETGGWPTYRATLVVAFEAVGQSRQPDNFDGTVDLMDNILAALRSSAKCWPAGKQASWSMRMGNVPVAENMYWAVITDIEA
jgi:hypothetical protein